MKVPALLGLSVAWLAFAASAQNADQLVARGRQSLCQSNLVAARNDFFAALSQSPNHAEANVLAAATRLLLLPQRPAVSNLLNRLGIARAGRDPYNWTADFTRNADGDPVFPPAVKSTEAITVYRSEVLPAVLAAQTNLSRITDPGFRLELQACESAVQAVTVDYGDILLLRALLHAAELLGETAIAHNFSVVIGRFQQLAERKELSLQRILSEYPALLNKGDATALARSKAVATNAIARYLAASEFIRDPARRPPGAERLFTLQPEDEEDEADFREHVTHFRQSLAAPVPFEPEDGHRVYAGAYFEGAKSLRSLLPKFAGDTYVPYSLPDYTLSGLLVGLPPSEVEAFLQQQFPRDDFSGIYLGRFDSSDGQIGLLIRTNGQASLLGWSYDRGVLDDGFQVDDGGEWNRATSEFSHGGNIYDDGECQGYVDAGGAWDSFGATRLPDAGPFQNAAGFYSGTFSTPGGTGQLKAILGADGQFIYNTVKPVDTPSSGVGMLDPQGQLDAFSFDDTMLTGSLGDSPLRLNGTFGTPPGSGRTFTLARSVALARPTPAGYSGIYVGRLDSGGTVALLVRTNRQATLLGWSYDRGVFFDEFQIDEDGFWYYEDNQFYHEGDIELDGSCSAFLSVDGRLDSFTATRLPDAGPFEDEAGYYGGTFNTLGVTGQLRAILTAEGEFIYTTLDPVDTPNNGGGILDSQGHFDTTSADGTMLSGSLRNNPLGLSGTFGPLGGSNRTFTLTRSAHLGRPPGPTVPVITRSPTNRDVVAGGNASFSVSATGTGPLLYQWWFNGEPILKATSPTLALTRVSQSQTGAYSLVVGNAAGSVRSGPANLTVRSEAVPPTITIVSPSRNARLVTNTELVTVRGTAADNSRVQRVRYSLNDAPWEDATGTTNWSATAAMRLGTNILQAFAEDESGNHSTTGRVSFVWAIAQRVVVQTLIDGAPGGGRITGVTNGQLIELGRSFSITATPYSSNLFVVWGGDVSNSAPKLNLSMRSNLTLIAIFAANPFRAAKGNYNGLFRTASAVHPVNSGFFSLSLTEHGGFSGKLQFPGGPLSFADHFDPAGSTIVFIPRGAQVALRMDLQLHSAMGSNQIRGQVAGLGWVADVRADLAGKFVGAAPTTRYTMMLPGAESAVTQPGGDGALTASVTGPGNVTLAGALGDGTPLNQSTTLSKDGYQPLYASLYANKGLVIGWLRYHTNGSVEGTEVNWYKPLVPADRRYSNGFEVATHLMGARYVPTATSTNVLGWTNGWVVLRGGNVPATTNPIVVMRNVVTVLNNSNQLALKLDAAKGTFSGSFRRGATTVPLSGVLIRPTGLGSGWFLGTNESGRVSLEPAGP